MNLGFLSTEKLRSLLPGRKTASEIEKIKLAPSTTPIAKTTSPKPRQGPAGRILEVSDSEFADFLRMQDDPAVVEKLQTLTLRVRNHCEIPPDVHNLPPHVIFMKDVDVNTGSQLEKFNAVVHGTARFSHLMALSEIGPDASFRHLILEGVQVHKFAGTVEESALFKNAYIVEFDPNARFEGDLSMEEGRLVRFDHRVGGNANFSGLRSLREIGSNASFGKNLCVSHSGLEQFHGLVVGDADFYRTNALHTIGPTARIGGSLNAIASSIANFEGQVEGNADFTNCSNLRRLTTPASFKGNVILTKTQIEEVSCPVGRLEAKNVSTLTKVNSGVKINTNPEAPKQAVNSDLKAKLIALD